MPRTLRDTEGGDQDSVPTSNSATRLPCADSRGGWDYCSPDETLRRGEEAAQALVVPCSGLHAHRPARSHSWPSRGPRFTARGADPTGGRGSRRSQAHVDATPHKGTLTREGRGLWVCTGASRMHNGACPGKGSAGARRRRPESHGTTTLDTRLPSGHQNLQSQAFWTHNPSAMTHSLRRNSWTRKPWDTHPFGHTNLSGTEPSNTPLRFTPLGHVPFGHTNPGRIASSNSQSEGCKPLRHSSPAHSSTLGPSDSSQPTDAIHRTLYRPRPDVRRTCSTWTLPH